MDSSLSSETDSADSGAQGQELCVPLDALAIDGQAPAPGDKVDVPCTVTRVENNMAYVTADAAAQSDSAAPDDSMLRQNTSNQDLSNY